MIDIDIPDYGSLHLEHLVFDYNGTLACDGEPLVGVAERLTVLSDQVRIHVVTADTFGKVKSRMASLPCEVHILPKENQAVGKLGFVRNLGADHTACFGNGRNDRLMLEEAALGVAVILEEGASAEAVASADVVCRDITSALDLLLNPLRLVATLRS
jgi:soluble P-type ATPase